MPREESARKKVLDATLKALLSTLDIPKWLKAPATLVAELSARFKGLPVIQQTSVESASDDEIQSALLQLDLATKHAASAAAGVSRIEEQTAAIRAAIESANAPTIIKYPGAIVQRVAGDQNFVVGNGNIHIGNVDMRTSTKKRRTPVLPGTLATDPYKVGYVHYLADRFNEFKEWEVGKKAIKYAMIRVAYKREMKFTIAHTPLDRFEDAVAFLQRRIRNSKLGRIKAGEGNRLFETFEEFATKRPNAQPLST